MIAVVLPSRGRVDLLARCLESCADTARGPVLVAVRYDDDDTETGRYLDPLFWGHGLGARLTVRPVSGPRLNGYASVPVFLGEAACAANTYTDLFFGVGDDAIFRTPGWDLAIRAAADQHPDGVYSIAPNPIKNAKNRPHMAISRTWLETLGFFLDPRIFWGDVWARDIAVALGRDLYLPDVVVEHAWAKTRRAEAAVQEKTMGQWTAEYHELHARCVAEAVEKLRPLVRPS